MNTALSEDLKALRSELASNRDEVEVTLRLPRESAQKVLALLDAEEGQGAVIVPSNDEYTTTEAATLLGMSRPTLMRMLKRRNIAFRMVGKHHRIPAASIRELRKYLDEDHMTAIAELSNSYGNTD